MFSTQENFQLLFMTSIIYKGVARYKVEGYNLYSRSKMIHVFGKRSARVVHVVQHALPRLLCFLFSHFPGVTCTNGPENAKLCNKFADSIN